MHLYLDTPDGEGISRVGGGCFRERCTIPHHVKEESVARRWDARDCIEKSISEVHLVKESKAIIDNLGNGQRGLDNQFSIMVAKRPPSGVFFVMNFAVAMIGDVHGGSVTLVTFNGDLDRVIHFDRELRL